MSIEPMEITVEKHALQQLSPDGVERYRDALRTGRFVEELHSESGKTYEMLSLYEFVDCFCVVIAKEHERV